MREHRNDRARIPVGVMLAFGLAACASAVWAQDRGACVTADVPEGFTLPDGSAHAAVRISLCTTRVLNPVVGLHLVRAADGRAALVMSERSQSREFADTRPVLLFHRGADGALDLVGYVVPFEHQAWRYALRHSNANGHAHSAALETARANGELVTLIASNVD